ncbi:MAG: M48 family metalloprotease [Pseudomonadota bacterium]
MRVSVLALLLLPLIAACSAPTLTPVRPASPPTQAVTPAVVSFDQVVGKVKPVAEATCRQSLPRGPCSFKVIIDTSATDKVNAFQTVDRQGRPLLVFTAGIVEAFNNQDEMAFVLGHEAAHHIEQHLAQIAQTAGAFTSIFETAAAASGITVEGQALAGELGELFGSRVYSKQFELEADALGTVIAKRAGFDPVRGAQFFGRLPDPGDQFLGTHPPNAERVAVVKSVAAQLQ